LFDRDTAPGGEPENLMRVEIPALIVPGRDAAHATSATRYLEHLGFDELCGLRKSESGPLADKIFLRRRLRRAGS
jgi:hypothetical protein